MSAGQPSCKRAINVSCASLACVALYRLLVIALALALFATASASNDALPLAPPESPMRAATLALLTQAALRAGFPGTVALMEAALDDDSADHAKALYATVGEGSRRRSMRSLFARLARSTDPYMRSVADGCNLQAGDEEEETLGEEWETEEEEEEDGGAGALRWHGDDGVETD